MIVLFKTSYLVLFHFPCVIILPRVEEFVHQNDDGICHVQFASSLIISEILCSMKIFCRLTSIRKK